MQTIGPMLRCTLKVQYSVRPTESRIYSHGFNLILERAQNSVSLKEAEV